MQATIVSDSSVVVVHDGNRVTVHSTEHPDEETTLEEFAQQRWARNAEPEADDRELPLLNWLLNLFKRTR